MPTVTPATGVATPLHDNRHGPLPMLLLVLTTVTGASAAGCSQSPRCSSAP